MADPRLSYDYAIHSDYLIHWTGKDIEKDHDPDWHSQHHSKTSPAVTALYTKRLRDILTHGLWMTEESVRTIAHNITFPATPACCFTELKLSLSRRHAREYGRLGIGVKRPFLFDRFGRPMCYYGYNDKTNDDRFLQACARELSDKTFLQFFKPMNKSDPLSYDLYAESEWRILYRAELLRSRKIIDPRDASNTAAHAYFKSLSDTEQEKLKYLIPLDGWFQMIIYPSIDTKNEARNNPANGIVAEIDRIKKNKNDHANRIEKGNWPVETNLDACRNF
jgi:hypothetical protein